jgi:P4 family phage/plasmid primase-like protien
MSNDTDFVNYFENHNLHLIRIAKGGHDAGKRPLDTGWQSTPLKYGAARKWHKSGGNLGWAVGPSYLVLDIDPRNGGDDSYDQLVADISLDTLKPGSHEVGMQPPVIITGSGGRHIYLSRDPTLPIRPGPLRGYPGIDIKTGASQVVIPGSTHPSGMPYLPANGSTWPGSPTSAPQPLLDLLTQRAQVPTAPNAAPNAGALYNCLTIDQCTALLAHNDPSRLDGYEQWISRLAAIHHATGGVGLNLAMEWSERDPKYAEVAEVQVKRRWASFDHPHDFPATVQTLIGDVRRIPAAGEIINQIEQGIAKSEFDDLTRLDDELAERIDQLPGGGWKSNHAAARQIILESFDLDILSQSTLHKKLAKELGIRHNVLNKTIKSLYNELKAKDKKEKIPLSQFILKVRDKTIEQIKDLGKLILRAPNEQYYIYNGQYWESESKECITHLVHKSVHALVHADPTVTFETTGVTEKAERSLRSEVFTPSKDLYRRDDVPSVINTPNGTIWIDEQTGNRELKPHCPDDALTTQINTPYEPVALCPCFDTMLEQAFAHITDDFQRSELIRHFWELIGYVIQPRKDIPLIMLWYGDGFNGKSTMSDFLARLVGPMCSQPVEMHELGNGKDNHALETMEGKLILIDDDLKSDARLSDGTLKKFSETKLIKINPKHKTAYTARVNVTPIILTNGYPIIRDLSRGLQRRIDVLPFESDLTPHIASDLPRIAREQEMSGILNRALDGLQRLRARRGFSRPQCCVDANNKFFSESNNVAAFIKFSTAQGEKCSLISLYSSYVQFCISWGERNNTERFSRFRAMLAQLGYDVTSSTVFGLKMECSEDEY